MQLIGMLDSPYVRRVAVSMHLLGLAFEHHSWSVGKDQAAIRRHNPLGRVPALILDDGEVLVESAAILDYLDERAGPERALLPHSGVLRRRALQLMALATGAADKGVSQLYERAFRPEDKRHAPWVERCRSQMEDALRALDAVAATTDSEWLLGSQLTQADITVTAVASFLHEALALDGAHHPALMHRVARAEALPAFSRYRLPFYTPQA